VRIETGIVQGALRATLVGPGGRVEASGVAAGGDLDGNGIEEQRVGFTTADLATVFSGAPVGTHRSHAELLIRCESWASSIPIDLTVIRPEGIAVVMAPNPLREKAQIQFFMPAPGPVRVEILGVDGRRAAILADGARHEAGMVQLPLYRHNLLPGLYFYRVVTGSGSASGRFVVLGF